MRAALPWYRLGLFYAFYFAIIGLMMPYWPLYLAQWGLSAVHLSWMVMAAAMTRILAPNLWAWWADRHGRYLHSVRTAALAAAMSAAAWSLLPRSPLLLLLMVLFNFFQNAMLAQFEVVALHWLGRQHHRYGHVRLYGSLAFMLTSLLWGMSMVQHMALLPWALCALCVALYLLCRQIPEVSGVITPRRSSTRPAWNRALSVFFAVNVLQQMAHGAYYTFYSLYLQDRGHGLPFIGFAWALAVAAETLLFAFLPRYIVAISDRRLFNWCLGLSLGRWLLIAVAQPWASLLLIAQLLHAASFAGFHLAGIRYVHQHFAAGSQGLGQALFSASGFGLGGVLGAAWAGWMWGHGESLTFVMAACVSAIAWGLWWAYGVEGQASARLAR